MCETFQTSLEKHFSEDRLYQFWITRNIEISYACEPMINSGRNTVDAHVLYFTGKKTNVMNECSENMQIKLIDALEAEPQVASFWSIKPRIENNVNILTFTVYKQNSDVSKGFTDKGNWRAC